MSETKTYVFPESGGNGGGSGMMAMLAPLLQQKGIDPNLLVAMNGKNNNSGFGGEGSWFIWVIFLFFLMGWGNNGNGWGNNRPTITFLAINFDNSICDISYHFFDKFFYFHDSI